MAQEFIQQENNIQKKIIQMLRPIAKEFPDQFIDGVLQIWLRKELLGKDQSIKRCYEKLIQIIVCIYHGRKKDKNTSPEFILPVQQVIHSLIKYIENANNTKNKMGKSQRHTLISAHRWSKVNPVLNPIHVAAESLLHQFLYTYLVYSPSMFDPILREDPSLQVRTREFRRVYQKMLDYFKLFKESRNPYTINWQLEILNILTSKFSEMDSVLDQRLKKEYTSLFTTLLTNCSQIMMDQFYIEFDKEQKYSMAFPPTIYELLWRYDYIQYKHTVTPHPSHPDDNELSSNSTNSKE